MKLSAEKWNVSIEFGTWTVGLGWWKGSHKVFDWSKSYYDGNIWSFRLGPLFMGRWQY